jgi:hypothetical protein
MLVQSPGISSVLSSLPQATLKHARRLEKSILDFEAYKSENKKNYNYLCFSLFENELTNYLPSQLVTLYHTTISG